MSKSFKRLGLGRRSDSRLQSKWKEQLHCAGTEPATEFEPQAGGRYSSDRGPDTSLDSNGGLSAHFDPSWRRNSVHQQQQQQPQQQQQQSQQQLMASAASSGGAVGVDKPATSKIKSLFRGIGIKRTKSATKLDKKGKSQRQQQQQQQQQQHLDPFQQRQQEQILMQQMLMQQQQQQQQQQQPPSLAMTQSAMASDSRSQLYNLQRQNQPHQLHNYDWNNCNKKQQQQQQQQQHGQFPRSVSSGPVLPQHPPAPLQQQQLSSTATSVRCHGGCPFDLPPPPMQQQQQSQEPALRHRHRLGGGGVSPASSASDRVASSCLPIGAGGVGGSFRIEPGTAEAHSYRPNYLPVPDFGAPMRTALSHESLIAPLPQQQQQQFSNGLKKVNRPDLENLRHRDNSLKLWIFEAKRLPPKKKYFCEICLDHILYARTTTKEKTPDSDPFWGEPFEFSNLQDIALVTVKLFREADKKKKKDKNQLIGEVRLPVHDIGSALEQWHTIATPQQQQQQQQQQLTQQQLPCIRLRSHYNSIDVLPLQCYRGFHRCLMQQAEQLVAALEPRLSLRDKEELAARLVSVAHADGRAQELLAGLVMQELAVSANDLLVFRGNSIATKAVEFFLKLVGSDYLRRVLSEPLSILLRDDPQCEVDPQRVESADTLAGNQRRLREFVDLFWIRLQLSASAVPPEIGRLFALIRQRLAESRRQELGDTLVSASLFLRFICPAILGPTLFNLTQELPSQRAARSLTLIAKTVQNLANGALYGSKEAYMQFMNRFLEERSTEMRLFLKAASKPSQQPEAPPGIDLGCELAQLHLLLSTVCADQQQQQQQQEPCLAALSGHLTALSHCLRHGGYATPGTAAIASSAASTAASVAAVVQDDDWVYSNVAEPSPPPQSQQQPPKWPPDNPLTFHQQYQHQHHYPAPSSYQQVRQQVSIQEDWKKMLEEANTFAAAAALTSGGSAAAGIASSVNANISSGGTVGGGVGGVCGPGGTSVTAGAAASTTGSSGYQSFTAASPVQFFNPTYQKGGCLPPLYSQSRMSSGSSDNIRNSLGDDDYEGGEADGEDEDGDPLDSPPRQRNSDAGGGNGSSSEMASSEASSMGRPPQRQLPPTRREVASQASQAASSPIDWTAMDTEAMRQKTRSLEPGAVLLFGGRVGGGAGSDDSLMMQQQQQQQLQRVRMGLRATQGPSQLQQYHRSSQQQLQQQQQQQHQQASPVSTETELQKLQRELAETKRQLQATETRLRYNEQEKKQLMAQVESKQQQQQQLAQTPSSDPINQQQMMEILQRLQSLECSLTSSRRQNATDSI